MKKIITLAFSLLCVLLLVGCSSTKADDEPFENSSSVNLEELKEKYPEYFGLSDFKGIEVYVWQMAEDSYRCGMMSGTNRMKTEEEILELQSKSLSIDEAKAILNELGVKKSRISVIAVVQPYSSYQYEIDDAYIEKVTKLFD